MIVLKILSVAELGIHSVWLWINNSGVNSVNVDEREAILFHYRSCCRVWQTLNRNSFLGIGLHFRTNYDFVSINRRVLRFKTKIGFFLKDLF